MEATRSSAQRRRAEEDAEEDRIEEEARQQRLAEEEAARQAEEARLKVGQADGASVMYLWHCSVILYPVCSSHNRLKKRLPLGAWESMRLAAMSTLRALQHPRHVHKDVGWLERCTKLPYSPLSDCEVEASTYIWQF